MIVRADLTTLDAIKAQLLLTSTDAADDRLIQHLIRRASAYIHQYTGRVFVPVRRTRTYDAYGPHLTARTLRLDEDLLEVVSLTNGDGTTIASTDYVLIPGSDTPKSAIKLLASGAVAWVYTTDYEQAIRVDGFWGYHSAYDDAWIDTLDTVEDNPLSASATTITVNDADGEDAEGSTRFAVGQYLRLENELVQVRAINTTTNSLTVTRAQLGTTATTHAQNTTIRRWAWQDDIEKACIDLTGWMYRNKAVLGDEIQILAEGSQVITNKAPVVIQQTLQAYLRPRMEVL